MYNHVLVEKKWRKIWKDKKVFDFKEDSSKPKFYALDMFPYPSGAGLHIGHVKSYTPTDVYARYKHYLGFNVLHPIGWDAFGLPAEQYALTTKNHPSTFTNQNIANFKDQINQLGFWFNWNKEINTTDPKFYQWTQWIFIQMYQQGLAEIKDVDVNWCQELGTVLANEEVLTDECGNKVSERGKFLVVKKPMKQWVLKITEYAQRLIDDLNEVDWTIGLKNIQKKWIGKSVGATIKFQIANSDKFIQVFTSRPDTIFGTTFIALSVDHEIVKNLINTDSNLLSFINQIKGTKEYERIAVNANKIGYKLNLNAIHPITQKVLPIYVCNYVLSNYGNGAIMGVPAGDSRDYQFAVASKIEIINIFENKILPCEEDAIHINSEFLNGLDNEAATQKIITYLQDMQIGYPQVNYKLKDWLFSRQRYWGEPFPVLFDENGEIIIEKNLPLLLPNTNDIKPSGDGRSPLANLTEWVNVKIGDKLYQRDTNTMPQWAGSCWYYLAYILKQDDGNYLPLNSNQAIALFKKWLPVDLYIGGQEHAVLHLLYARFWHKFLYDLKIVSCKEPFYQVINQGMILVDGEKMSKSKGNVVNPTDVINSHGADVLRLYMMFMGPITASLPWDDSGLDGMYKWVQRVYRLFETKPIDKTFNAFELEKKYHLFVKKSSGFIDKFDFNLAISEMMIFVNECYKYDKLNYDYMLGFIIILSCFAPFVCEEINQVFLQNQSLITTHVWPKYDETKIKETTINIPIQVNGKTRSVIEVSVDINEADLVKIALADLKIKSWIVNKEIIKHIYVKNKILNLIIK